MRILRKRRYADGPHGRVIAGVEAEGDRRAAPSVDDRKQAPEKSDAKPSGRRKSTPKGDSD